MLDQFFTAIHLVCGWGVNGLLRRKPLCDAQDGPIRDNSLSILQKLRDVCRFLHWASYVLELDPRSQTGTAWYSVFS